MSSQSSTGPHAPQATWGGRFSEGPSDLMLRFSESVSFDHRLALFDIAGSRAHAAMLAKVGLLTEPEHSAIDAGLAAIAEEVRAGSFPWDPALEDVHMNIERRLTERVPAAAKLHTARSRNDQVATDMRLFIRAACTEIDGALGGLLRTLVDLADANRGILIPGYTHLQRAQPVSAAHHLLAWAAMFGRDRERFAMVRERVNVCPLGSGALAGTTLPIDREATAAALGFVDADGNPRVTRNSMDAVADRDSYIEFVTACAIAGVHISRVAEDLILWASSEFRFCRLPDAFTTGSSLMPQKKNPDSLELLRGKAARLQGHVTTLLTLCKGLPLTYNRDLQEDKPPLFDACDTTLVSLQVLEGTVAGMSLNADVCAAAVTDPLLLATDLADHLVLAGVPFREAHHVVGKLVAIAEQRNVPLPDLTDDQARSVDSRIPADWRSVFDLQRAMAARERPGMPGPGQIANEIADWRRKLA